MKLSFIAKALAVVGLAAATSLAHASDFPNRPLRLLVPFGPGSAPDVLAREIAPHMAEHLGQSVVVENRPGAGGNVTVQALLSEAKDGHTVLLSTDSMFSLNPYLFPRTFDVMKEVRLVTPISEAGLFFVANAKLGVNTVDDVVKLVQANPGKFNYSAPTGTPHQMAGERLTREKKLDWVRISYRDPQQVVTELVNGMVPFTFGTLPLVEGFVKEGTLKLVAVATPERLSLAPEVPTFAESIDGFVESAWYALAVAAGTPDEAIAKINAAAEAARDSQPVQARLAQLGMVPLKTDVAALTERANKEAAMREELIRDRSISVD